MSRFALLNVATLGSLAAAALLAPPSARAWALAGLGAVWLFLFVRGVAHPRSSLFLPVISRGADPRRIALTFDDGPGEATRSVLSILREHGVKATFFLVGQNLAGREDLVRAIVAGGHTVGSHSFGHSRLTNFLSRARMKDEVARGIEAIAKVAGKRPRLYRPPVGLKSPAVASAARALDLVVVGWSRRGLDGGAGASAAGAIVTRLVRARGGEILLLHDGSEPGRPGDRAGTVAALRELLPLLKARGFGFATVDDLLGERPYAAEGTPPASA